MKAEELSLDEWHALLEPYGYADIVIHSLPSLAGQALVLYYEIRVMFTAPDGDRDEWELRSGLLDRARRVVRAVQAKGYIFMDAPRIEFSGHYKYRVDRGAEPEWYAEAEVSFRVHAT